MKTSVTTYYLEMNHKDEFRPRSTTVSDFEVRQALVPSPEFNRFLYTAVGGDWYWIDRLEWTYEEWLKYLSRPQLQTWCAYSRGNPVGYFELEHMPETGVEIVYFGILPQFVGKGFGAALLAAAVEKGWAMGPKRVWLHTCTLDHKSALSNYQARGFRLYTQETKEADLPAATPGPWPGAKKPSSSLE